MAANTSSTFEETTEQPGTVEMETGTAGAIQEEFESLTSEHKDSLDCMALNLTRNMADAQDLVQETLMKAYRFFHKFEQGTNIKAWLFTIMKNTHINRYNRAKKLPQKVDFEEVENFCESIMDVHEQRGMSPEEVLFSDLLTDDTVRQAIDELPEVFRQVVLLCDLEDYSYKEIAEMAHCPIGTVMSRLFRGRQLLREQLKGYASSFGYA